MVTVSDNLVRVRETFQAAADCYDHPVNGFWERFGSATVERLDLRAGQRVLDVCCGTGSSALAAAERVGPSGFVLGVDLARNPLELARAKARARGLGNVEFVNHDMLELPLPAASFDAVVCVFGIFFVADMPQAVRRLWRSLKPGGRLGITTWGSGLFAPASDGFWRAVRAERPDVAARRPPWERLGGAQILAHMMSSGGVPATTEVRRARHLIAAPEDWWAIVMGSGFREVVEELSEDERARVRDASIADLRRSGAISLTADVVYGTAVKSAAESAAPLAG